MSNTLMNNMLTEVVMEKAIKDKIKKQQKEQQEAEKFKQRNKSDDEEDLTDEEDQKFFAKMKEERLKEIMSQNKQIEKKENNQYQKGEYREIVEEEFLPYTTKNFNIVVHFYHKEFIRCQIMDKHLQIIGNQHPECVFAPFFTKKLQIKVIPTLCLFNKGVLIGQQIGFEGFSGDEFKTIELTRRLVKGKMIKPLNQQEAGTQVSKVQKEQYDSDDSDF